MTIICRTRVPDARRVDVQPVTTVGGGLADMWDQKERGTAVVFYSLAVVAGPTLGWVAYGSRWLRARFSDHTNRRIQSNYRQRGCPELPWMALDRVPQSDPDQRDPRARHHLSPRDIRACHPHEKSRAFASINKEMGVAFQARGEGSGSRQVSGKQFNLAPKDDRD